MNDIGFGRRLAMRVVLLQAGCAAAAGLLFWAFKGGAAALAAFCGGMIAAVGSALLGWRTFAPGVAAATRLRRAMFAGEALKWIWFVTAIWAALVRFQLMPLPLIVGLITAQFAYFGLMATNRG